MVPEVAIGANKTVMESVPAPDVIEVLAGSAHVYDVAFAIAGTV
jgi:hypothetical protein